VTRHVALLRAVNVTGVNRVAMKELAALFGTLGHRDVVTYIQSGNVVFSTDLPTASLRPTLRAAINAHFSLAIDLVVLDAAELVDIVDRFPFKDEGRPRAGSHIGFLADAVTDEVAARLDPNRSPPDEFVVDGRAVHLSYPSGVGRTKLTTAYVERTLGTIMTVRNWNTVERLVQLSST
jgi:uncharacterized protein (DUF1697 family)